MMWGQLVKYSVKKANKSASKAAKAANKVGSNSKDKNTNEVQNEK